MKSRILTGTSLRGGVVAETQYMTVNIMAANAGTRAEDNSYEQGTGSYEDGTPTENTVNSVRFYFFDEDGEPAIIKYNPAAGGERFVSYYDVAKQELSNGDHSQTIEKMISAQIVIQNIKNADDNDKVNKLPKYMVAILNPTDELKERGNLSLDELNSVVEDYANLANATTDPSFVMSNSVYVSEGELTNAVTIVEGKNIHKTEKEATDNPVKIYVERAVAKLSVEVKLKEGEPAPTVIDETTLYDTGVKYNGEPVYVQFLGWNVTATTNQAYLLKHINSAWAEATGKDAATESGLFKTEGQPWNIDIYHRSFWGYNPTVNYIYGKFDDTNPNTTFAQLKTDFTGTEHIYLQENAGAGKESDTEAKNAKPSQVIIAAQLVQVVGEDKQIVPLKLFEYYGTKFVYGGNEKDPYEEVKKEFLSTLPNSTKYYRYDEEKEKYIQLSTADIEIKSAWDLAGENETPDTRYLVYPVLANENVKWYLLKKGTEVADDGTVPEDALTEVETDDVKATLKSLGSARIWNEGYTYYYFDIRHLSNNPDAPGYYGVVRNHVYKNTITSIVGLGTPVFDPSEIIIPEKPEEEETFVAAQINILSWRIVNNSDIPLEW